MEITDFIPKWTKAVKTADKEHIECLVTDYKFPEYQYDNRIKYFKKNFELDFAVIGSGVVTEAHNWNSLYFRRDTKKHFCDVCNTLEKEPAYFAITKGGKYFSEFKKNLWNHFKESHSDILYSFDTILVPNE